MEGYRCLLSNPAVSPDFRLVLFDATRILLVLFAVVSSRVFLSSNFFDGRIGARPASKLVLFDGYLVFFLGTEHIIRLSFTIRNPHSATFREFPASCYALAL